MVRKKLKVSFSDDMIVFIENLREATDKIVELIKALHTGTGYRILIMKLIALLST